MKDYGLSQEQANALLDISLINLNRANLNDLLEERSCLTEIILQLEKLHGIDPEPMSELQKQLLRGLDKNLHRQPERTEEPSSALDSASSDEEPSSPSSDQAPPQPERIEEPSSALDSASSDQAPPQPERTEEPSSALDSASSNQAPPQLESTVDNFPALLQSFQIKPMKRRNNVN